VGSCWALWLGQSDARWGGFTQPAERCSVHTSARRGEPSEPGEPREPVNHRPSAAVHRCARWHHLSAFAAASGWGRWSLEPDAKIPVCMASGAVGYVRYKRVFSAQPRPLIGEGRSASRLAPLIKRHPDSRHMRAGHVSAARQPLLPFAAVYPHGFGSSVARWARICRRIENFLYIAIMSGF
jgi:hypothetical protein